MNAELAENAYGKSHIRLTKVTRGGDRHELKEISVDVQLRGRFEACYHKGDNSGVLPTDTMKNTVYALAAQHDLESIEAFAFYLSDHFLNHEAIPHCTSARIDIREDRWKRLKTGGKEHVWAFVSGGSRSAPVRSSDRAGRCALSAGSKPSCF